MRVNRPSKVCTVCGREITWRKKWERDWENVRYCSDGCRKRKNSAQPPPTHPTSKP
ncbi:MAG: DUF2256 domain-containing protein [Phycisphaerales bacterium]|nr:DUF2256 domain-containing protein [Phycisphaerales bacterium]